MLRKAIWDELRRLRDEGRTLLVTTQYVAEAEYCDRVAMIVDGRLVALDTPDELRDGVRRRGDRGQRRARGRPRVLANLEGVLAVRQTAPRQLMVTVGCAAPYAAHHRGAPPGRRRGRGIEEHQPTFDEVFTGLVEQRRAQGNGDDTDG